jgi:multicomponent Na+:H+ antiporter subunit B
MLFAVGAVALTAFYAWGLLQLPSFGHVRSDYGHLAARLSLTARHSTDTVSGVNFDIRALDTLGEELILFTAAAGAATILRRQRHEEEDAESDEEQGRDAGETSDALRIAGLGLIAIVLLVGVYVLTHGQLTPGGGFQAGVILAAGVMLVYLAGEFTATGRLRPPPLMEVLDAGGAASYALIGLGGMLAGGAFFHNFVTRGTTGKVLSSGTIALNSVAVGIEVTGAFVLLLAELLEQVLVMQRKSA